MAPATLITMVDDSRRRIRAFVVEKDISHICAGEQAQISADGASQDPSEGRIDWMGAELAENPDDKGISQSRAIKLSLPKTNRFLIGRTVTVKLLGCSS
jgi:multidrug resistance efflux pump